MALRDTGQRVASRHPVIACRAVHHLDHARCEKAGDLGRIGALGIGDEQARARDDALAGRQPVGLQDRLGGGAAALGDRRDGLAPREFVRPPADQALARLLVRFDRCQEAVQVLGRDLDAIVAGCGDHRAVVRRVQRDELAHAHAGELGGQFQIDRVRLLDHHEVRLVEQFRQREAEHVRVLHDVPERDQLGYVVPGFARHAQAQVVGRFAARLRALDRPTDRAFTPVVRRQRQKPVAVVQTGEHLQVVEGRAGGLHHVAPVVYPPVLLQVVGFAGRRDELPQTRGLRARQRGGVHRALDEGQERDLHRHPTRLDLLHDMEQIATAAAKHAIERIGTSEVLLFLLLDQRRVQVGHREAGADAFPEAPGAWRRLRGQRGRQRRLLRHLQRQHQCVDRVGIGRHADCEWLLRDARPRRRHIHRRDADPRRRLAAAGGVGSEVLDAVRHTGLRGAARVVLCRPMGHRRLGWCSDRSRVAARTRRWVAGGSDGGSATGEQCREDDQRREGQRSSAERSMTCESGHEAASRLQNRPSSL